jgi:hypothetical protein
LIHRISSLLAATAQKGVLVNLEAGKSLRFRLMMSYLKPFGSGEG